MDIAVAQDSSRTHAFVPPDAESSAMVDRLLRAATRICTASSATFFWVGANDEIAAPQSVNIAEDSVARYNEHWSHLDPIHVTRLRQENRQVAVLSHVRRSTPAAQSLEYQRLLNEYGVGDEVALMFCHHGAPLASLSMFRAQHEPAFSLDCFDWEALRDLVKSSLGRHWRVRSENARDLLRRRYGLSVRELEVVRYVTLGKSNQEIAQILSIGLQTVKSHVVAVMDKAGVDSRLGIACLTHRLELMEGQLS